MLGNKRQIFDTAHCLDVDYKWGSKTKSPPVDLYTITCGMQEARGIDKIILIYDQVLNTFDAHPKSKPLRDRDQQRMTI